MKHFLYILCLITFLSGCTRSMKSTEEEQASVVSLKEEDNKVLHPIGEIYRADGYLPDVPSEFCQVAYDYGVNNAIWYWNIKDDRKVRLDVLRQEYHQDLGAITGNLKFPNDEVAYSFSSIEGAFNLGVQEGEFKEFMYESSEE